MSTAEDIGEARALSALIAAHGHPEIRKRLSETLRADMPDADKLPMLRYDMTAVLDAGTPLPGDLRIRLERFTGREHTPPSPKPPLPGDR